MLPSPATKLWNWTETELRDRADWTLPRLSIASGPWSRARTKILTFWQLNPIHRQAGGAGLQSPRWIAFLL